MSRAAAGTSFLELQANCESEFDTTPILNAFENTIDALNTLNEIVAADIAQLEASYAKKEEAHKITLGALQNTVEVSKQGEGDIVSRRRRRRNRKGHRRRRRAI